jgi:RHH-type proline utilization regulon transcriptional repressor/proline dehydrogenase/delta 1-pyrroline-5-carboxylate dehydrogenase
MLYGMADPFKKSLIDMGVRVREYDPMGELVPGLSYLVRRLLENSANDSFLKQTFLNRKEMNQLLAPPR